MQVLTVPLLTSDGALVVVGVLAILILFLTEHSVRKHRATVHIGKHDGVFGVWIKPPEKPLRWSKANKVSKGQL